MSILKRFVVVFEGNQFPEIYVLTKEINLTGVTFFIKREEGSSSRTVVSFKTLDKAMIIWDYLHRIHEMARIRDRTAYYGLSPISDNVDIHVKQYEYLLLHYRKQVDFKNNVYGTTYYFIIDLHEFLLEKNIERNKASITQDLDSILKFNRNGGYAGIRFEIGNNSLIRVFFKFSFNSDVKHIDNLINDEYTRGLIIFYSSAARSPGNYFNHDNFWH